MGHLIGDLVVFPKGSACQAYFEYHETARHMSAQARFGSCPSGFKPRLFAYMQSLLHYDPLQRATLLNPYEQQVWTLDPVGTCNSDRCRAVNALYTEFRFQRCLIPLAVNILDRYCDIAGGWPVSTSILQSSMWLANTILKPERHLLLGVAVDKSMAMLVSKTIGFRLHADTVLSLLLSKKTMQDIDHDSVQRALLVEPKAALAVTVYFRQQEILLWQCPCSTCW